jgi:hypothetical protein
MPGNSGDCKEWYERHFIPALVLGCQIVVIGQNPPTQGSSQQGTPTGSNDESRSTPAPALTGVIGIDAQLPEEDSSSTLPQMPPLLGGPKLSVALRSESERSNYLRGGINVGATYDDNALLTPQNELGNTSYSVFPNISLEQVRARAKWKFGYAAGLTVNQRLTNQNQGSHDLNFESLFRLSPHVNLRVAEDFFLSSGVFAPVNGSGAGSGVPNGSILTPLAQQRSNSTVVETNYHFALNDMVGAIGSFSDLHFSDVPSGAASLSDTRTTSGSAYWLHGFGRDWLGIDYHFQRVTFDASSSNSGGETRVHSILAVNTITLPNRFTLSAFLGPEYSENQGLVVGGTTTTNFSDWSFSGGADLRWQKDHTSVALGYSRRISDGGGVLGVVRLQGVHGESASSCVGLAISGAGAMATTPHSSVRGQRERDQYRFSWSRARTQPGPQPRPSARLPARLSGADRGHKCRPAGLCAPQQSFRYAGISVVPASRTITMEEELQDRLTEFPELHHVLGTSRRRWHSWCHFLRAGWFGGSAGFAFRVPVGQSDPGGTAGSP